MQQFSKKKKKKKIETCKQAPITAPCPGSAQAAATPRRPLSRHQVLPTVPGVHGLQLPQETPEQAPSAAPTVQEAHRGAVHAHPISRG